MDQKMNQKILILFCLSMVVLHTNAVCPKSCTCDSVAKSIVCNSVNSSSLLEEVAKNVEKDTEKLILSRDGLTSFDAQFDLKKLTILDLTGNLLMNIPSGLPQMFPSLRTLLLDENLIETLRPKEFIGLENITKLSLKGNKLTKIESGTFQILKELSQLYLSNNQISLLSSGSFNGLTSMLNLELEKNKISVLPSGIFDTFKSYKIRIILTWNLLTEIPNGLFETLLKFETFDASHNQVVKLGDKAFNGITAQIIGLQNNSISKLNPGSFFNSSIDTLALDLNPLICDCDLRKLAGYVKTVNYAQCSNVPTRLSNTSHFENDLCTQCDFIVCHHQGVCTPIGKSDYNCECTKLYSGKNCKIYENDGISPAVIVGIVLAVVFIILVLLVLFFRCRGGNNAGQCRTKKEDSDAKHEKMKLKDDNAHA